MRRCPVRWPRSRRLPFWCPTPRARSKCPTSLRGCAGSSDWNPDMTLDRRTQALLALVEADRAQKCAAIEADARARCAALLAQAHADARAKMRAAFAEERAHRDLRIAAAQATLQTRLRLALQHRSATFLAAGWRRLPRALDARWADAAARAAWVDAIVAEAQDAF